MCPRARTGSLGVTAARIGALVFTAVCGEILGPDNAGPPAALTALTTGALSGVVATELPTAIAFRVTDSRGRPTSGARVSFTISGNASLSASSDTSDASGEVRTRVTLGTVAGSYIVRAAVHGVELDAEVLVTALAGPATAMRFGSAPGPSRTDMPLSTIRVALQDAHGNVVTNATDRVTVALGGNAPSATLSGTLTVNASGGVATFADLTINKPGTYTLAVSASGFPALGSDVFSVTGLGRSDADRPDDVSAAQVHVVYVIPSDGKDRYLDVSGSLQGSVASFHAWFIEKSGGLAFRFDTHQGELDVTYLRMSKTDAEVKAAGAFVRNEVEQAMRAAGRLRDDKMYLAYYDGGSTYACGGASWPPNVPGRLAAMYLLGTPPNGSCPATPPSANGATDFPRYWEFAALHDLVHTLGVVSANAPNHQAQYPAHVPERHDLMFSGPSSWIINSTTVIDVNGDDYFGANTPQGVARLVASPFVMTVAAALVSRPAKPNAAAEALLRWQLERLPVHEPFTITRRSGAPPRPTVKR